MEKRPILALLILGLFHSIADCQEPGSAAIDWQVRSLGSSSSFRGLSLIDDQNAWTSGSQGSILRTVDGGASWIDVSPKGFEELEFRSIHAFSPIEACVASAGAPAILLRTEDGGEHWKEVFRHPSPKAFFDAMVFWSPLHGLAVSDPIDGYWLIVQTEDGGRSWREVSEKKRVQAKEGEAAFAASNGSLAVIDGRAWLLGTGGATGESKAAVLRWDSKDSAWNRALVPMASRESSGIFALEMSRYPFGVAVGGDFQLDSKTDGTAAWTEDGGKSWHDAIEPPSGYRSSIAVWNARSDQECYVSVGPNGTDISRDGKRWFRAASAGFHVVRAHGSSLWAVGSQGRFGKVSDLK